MSAPCHARGSPSNRLAPRTLAELGPPKARFGGLRAQLTDLRSIACVSGSVEYTSVPNIPRVSSTL